MKRSINFVSMGAEGSTLHAALGMSEERAVELIARVKKMIDAGHGLTSEVIFALNEQGDLDDSEWTFIIYGLGYNWAKREMTMEWAGKAE